MTTHRRTVLASATALAGAAIAGCSSSSEQTGSLTVQVYNGLEQAQTVTVTVTDADGTVRTERSGQRIQPSVSASFDSDGYEPGQYTITVQSEMLRASGTWNPRDCRRFRLTARLTVVDGTTTASTETTCLDA